MQDRLHSANRSKVVADPRRRRVVIDDSSASDEDELLSRSHKTEVRRTAMESRRQRVVVIDDHSSDEDELFRRSPAASMRPTATGGHRGRVVIDSSSSDEDELPNTQEPPTLLGTTRRHREGLLPSKAETVSDLEFNMNALRLADPPSERNDSFVQEKASAGRKFDKGIQDGNEWVYDERYKEYTLPRPPSESSDQWPIVRVPESLFDKLFDFQKTGVYWMAQLHAKKIGGILGDDMGMGKTYTTLTFLGGLLKGGTIKNALIVSPVSVLRSWEKEANNIIGSCISGVRICVVSSELARTSRIKILREAHASLYQPHIVITTFGLMQSSPDDFKPVDNRDCCWDYVVLDESHVIRNHKTAVSQNCKKIGSDKRTRLLSLTGTPIMNRLTELWTLIDFVTKGQVLPTLQLFMKQFAKPIEAARHKDAPKSDIVNGERANKELQERIRPYFLQRLKIDFLRDWLPEKRELVIWTHLSPKQRLLYQNYINFADSVTMVLSGEKSSPLVALSWLKKLCGHPLLVEEKSDEVSNAVDLTHPDVLTEQSAKLGILSDLIVRLRQSGHKTLIFSQSTRMLDIIERVLVGVDIKLERIDGSTKERERQRLVDDFNKDDCEIDAMLLSTKAAGVGLTLTGADRAVIYDPSWNPAEDSQAVDRCYRIGQKSEVTVYRLIAAGTVEEKMYEKQIYKDGIRRTVTTNAEHDIERYFDRDELRKLFSLAPAGESDVLSKLTNQGSRIPLGSSGKPTFLSDHKGVVGVSSHDGLYRDDVVTAFDGSPKKGNPFEGGTQAPPMKVTGRSQRALLKPSNEEQPMPRKLQDRTLKSTNLNPVVVSSSRKQVESVGAMFRQADSLRDKGELSKALGLLLDVLENMEVTREEKTDLHKRISMIANEKGWLP